MEWNGTIFREEREPTAQPPVVEDEEPVLVIPMYIPDTVFQDDSSGEKAKRQKTPWLIGQ